MTLEKLALVLVDEKHTWLRTLRPGKHEAGDLYKNDSSLKTHVVIDNSSMQHSSQHSSLCFSMNLFTVIIATLLLAGCTLTQSHSRIEEEVKLVLQSVFEKEDIFPPERNVLKLREHAWNLEMMLRSVQMEKDKDRIREVLKRYFLKYERNLGEAKRNLEAVVAETGCSKALLLTLSQRTQGINFEFFESPERELNAKYRYSRLILDERAMYPNHIPLTMQVLTPPRE